jgi:uncharacterized protein (DUF849 family)
MLIKVALNGGRKRSEHPGIPITATELGADAAAAVAAGAGAIHFHARSPDEGESIRPEDVAAGLIGIRNRLQNTPVGVSTGAWIEPDVEKRYDAVSRWNVLPDFASVNFKEDGAVELADLLLRKGVKVEAGISDMAGTDVFLRSGLDPRCLRILIEPMDQNLGRALEALREMVATLDQQKSECPRVLHGMEAIAWEMIDEAARRGYGTRVGFEDVLTLPGNRPTNSNAELVAEAVRRMKKKDVAG